MWTYFKVAIIGLPGGLELRHEKLKEMVKTREIDFYETMGRDLILYWRCLKPNDKRNLKVDVLAAIPGKFTGPASRAYLYYTGKLCLLILSKLQLNTKFGFLDCKWKLHQRNNLCKETELPILLNKQMQYFFF